MAYFPPPFSLPALWTPLPRDMLIILWPGRPGSAPGFQKSGKRFQEAARQMTHARWEGLHLYRPGIPRFRLHFRRFHVLFPGEIHQRKRFLRPRASPSLETGSRPGFSGATGQWNAYLDGKHALCLRSGADWFFLRHCGNLHPAVPPDGERLPLRRGFILALITLLQFTCGNFTPDGSVNSWVDRHWLAGRLHGGVCGSRPLARETGTVLPCSDGHPLGNPSWTADRIPAPPNRGTMPCSPCSTSKTAISMAVSPSPPLISRG